LATKETIMNYTVQGLIQGTTLSVDAGDVLEMTDDLTLEADGIIEIAGTIKPASGTFGAGITIHSISGRIYVSGKVTTADGESGDDADGVTNVVGDDGDHGGNITIIADKGSIAIEDGAKLETGDGGWGGNATAHGPAATITADSGKGGDGGKILLQAWHAIEVRGTLSPGEGGPGGDATADYSPAQDTDSVQRPALVKATAHPGGNGGDVSFVLGGPHGGDLVITGVVQGGHGSGGGSADANDGIRSEAYCSKAGRGGNIDVKGPPNLAISDANAKKICGGTGGRCGELDKVIADAKGDMTALAQTSDGAVPAGGDAGGVAWPMVETKPADAGDSGDCKAVAAAGTKTAKGSAHNKTTPGKAATASA
jgi:hypothetical protein